MPLVDGALRRLRWAARVKCAYAITLGGCALVPALSGPMPVTSATRAHEWPSTWDGAPLRPLATSDIELRFSRGFPGAIARMTDGRRQLVLRHVDEPTRMLHPASSCYAGLGYRIGAAGLETDAQQRRWRCFEVTRGADSVRVCERIEAADGSAFTDASSWYWSALTGRSRGPWVAVTTAERR